MAKTPAYEEIKQKLKEEIIKGTLRGGDRITIEEVAERFHTSCMPAREAIKSLQTEGLIELIPRRGARIKDIDAKNICNLYDVIIAIETMITVEAAKKCTEKDLAEWLMICDVYDDLVKRGEYRQAYSTNRRLHEFHFDLAGNNTAREIYLQCYNALDIARNVFPVSKERQLESSREHYLIADLMKMKAYDALAQVVTLHISKTRDLIAASVQSFNNSK